MPYLVGMTLLRVNDNLTSAGIPVPDFHTNTKDEQEDFKWKMEIYEQEIMPREYPKIYETTRTDFGSKRPDTEQRPAGGLP